VADFIRKDEQKDVKAFIKPYLARHKIWAIWSLSDPMPFLSRLGGRMLRGSKKPERSPTMAGPTQPSPHHP
jgi:hypothetical protein